MKRVTALILVFVLLTMLFAGCHGTETPSPSPSNTPIDLIPRDDGEISLEGLANPEHITVDASGVLYVDDSGKVYSIGADNKPLVLIEGLTQCAGLSVVGETLYLFDVRDMSLTCLSYDLQGKKQNEQQVDISEKGVYEICIFQNLPYAFIKSGTALSGMFYYLYNLNDGTTEEMSDFENYSVLIPLADGRLIGHPYGTMNKADILTVESDGSVTTSGSESITNTMYNFVFDISTRETYVMLDGDIMLLTQSSRTAINANPYADVANYSVACANKRFHFLESGGKKITVLTPSDTPKERVLRIMYPSFDGSLSGATLNAYIKYFKSAHPEIEVQTTAFNPSNDTQKLKLLSGEMEADILLIDKIYEYTENGVAADLSTYSSIVSALDQPALLDGVKENCMNIDGTLFGVPSVATYQGYVVNEALFQKLGLTPPNSDWTVNEYCDLAEKVSGDTYLCAAYRGYPSGLPEHSALYRLQAVGNTSPLLAGFNSATGYQVNIDTPEMVDFVKKGRELFDTFPFGEISLETSDVDSVRYSENALLWTVNSGEIESVFGFQENLSNTLTQSPQSALPIPKDSYGNGATPFNTFITIYSKAGNTGDAALFISEYLDESWHKENVSDIQLYKDISSYNTMSEGFKSIEKLMETSSKYSAVMRDLPVLDTYRTLEDMYFADEITAEAFVKQLHEAVRQYAMG